ncbi:MAG TPA: hypothetical protein VNQ73_06935 [Ilumatobacter sp.]|nr:hypothetical protein [Ilumatobacter sp.]
MAAVRDDVEGRIEIELVEHEPPRRWARDDPATARVPIEPEPVAADEDADATPTEATGRGRVVGIAAGVGAAGLLIGWLAGGVGNDGNPATDAGPTGTRPVATAAPPASFGDNPALVEPDAPVLSEPTRTTRPRATTTTTVPEARMIGPIPGVDPALVGLPYEIVTEDGRGHLQYIDLATNTITTLGAARGNDTGQLFAGDGWVIVPNGSMGSALAYYDGDPAPHRINDFDAWSVLHAPGASTWWVADETVQMGLPGTMIEIDATGTPTGATVALPTGPMEVDSDGTFLVHAPGGAYLVSSAGTSRLTTGEVIAAGATTVLARECDESLDCGYVVVDRRSGERRLLPGLSDELSIERLWRWGMTTRSISPDGAVAMVSLPIWQPMNGGRMMNGFTTVIVDLVNGQTEPLDVEMEPWTSGVSWTDDSQYAFLLVNGEVLAWSRETGAFLSVGSVPDDAATRRLQVFAVRPSDGTPWFSR